MKSTENENGDLFSEFEPVTKEEWLERVRTDLKDKLIHELNREVEPDLEVAPFYHPEDFPDRLTTILPLSGGWQTGAYLKGSVKNKELLTVLNNGVESLYIVLKDDFSVNWAELFKDIRLEWISLNIETKGGRRHLSSLKEYLNSNYDDLSKLSGSVQEIDALGMRDSYTHFMDDTTPFRNFHLFDGEESETPSKALGDLLRQYHRLVSHYGEKVSPQAINCRLNTSLDFYTTVAKFRALRLLFSNFQHHHEGESKPVPQLLAFVHPKEKNPYKYLVKATIECLAAVIGGADEIFIVPSSGDDKSPGFHQRMAINIQQIMKLESGLDQYIDPFRGAYFIEVMTRKLAERSWKLYQTWVH